MLKIRLKVWEDRTTVRSFTGTVSGVRLAHVEVAIGGGPVRSIPFRDIIMCVITAQNGQSYDLDKSEIRAFLTQYFEEKLTMLEMPKPVSFPTSPFPAPATGADRIAAMEDALATEIAKQERAELVATKQQAVKADLSFVNAQAKLLGCIDTMLRCNTPYTTPMVELAEHHKALKPLAEQHGYKIVLVGDKTSATLVAA